MEDTNETNSDLTIKFKNKVYYTSQVPARHGLPWRDEEHKQLISELLSHKEIEEIANDHNRSEGGIRARMKIIIFDLFKENKTFEEISNMFNIHVDEVKDYYKKYKQRCEKRVLQLDDVSKHPVLIPDKNKEQYFEEKEGNHILILNEMKIISKNLIRLNENFEKLISSLNS